MTEDQLEIIDFPKGHCTFLAYIGLLRHARDSFDPSVNGIMHRNQFVHVQTTAGLLPAMQPGFCYVDGRLDADGNKRQRELEIHIDTLRAQRVLIKTLAQDLGLRESYPFLAVLEKANTRAATWHVFVLKDQGVTLILPAFVGLLFYWCRTTPLAQLFLTGSIRTSADLDRCREPNYGFAANNDRVFEVALKETFALPDLPVIARMDSDPVALQAAVRVCSSLTPALHRGHFYVVPEFHFPFAGKTRLRVRGIPGQSTTYGRVLLVDRILSCSHPFAFDAVRPIEGFYAFTPNAEQKVAGSKPDRFRIRVDSRHRTKRDGRPRRVTVFDSAFTAYVEEEPYKVYRGQVSRVKAQPQPSNTVYGVAPGSDGRGAPRASLQGSNSKPPASSVLPPLPLDVFGLTADALKILQQQYSKTHALTHRLLIPFPHSTHPALGGFPEDCGVGAYVRSKNTVKRAKQVLIAEIHIRNGQVSRCAYLIDVERQGERAQSALLVFSDEPLESPYERVEHLLRAFAGEECWQVSSSDHDVARVVHRSRAPADYAQYLARKLLLIPNQSKSQN
jgi:hypothetical protein